jgi:hypothetical protein
VFRQNAYLASLKNELERIIEMLDLKPLQKEFLRLRRLDQVLWMEERANNTKILYYILRLTTIVGGVIIPALVSIRVPIRVPSEGTITLVVFVVSLLVAISAALEGFLRYGEQWRHYRLKVELLKEEGWLFLQLSGRYHRFKIHENAYATFARRVEEWNRLEVGEYITEVARDKTEEDEVEEEEEARERTADQ